jgi:hypothetical protein
VILCSTIFQLPFFHIAQYSVCGVQSARSARSVRRVFRACATLNASSPNTTICITHGVFGASSAYRWNVSVEKKFGLPLRCANLHLRCAAPWISLAPSSILRALPSFLLAPNAPTSFVLVPQQMAAVNFGHFYCMKLFVKMDRKVTSNIKLKKYKIVNKKVLIVYVLF